MGADDLHSVLPRERGRSVALGLRQGRQIRTLREGRRVGKRILISYFKEVDQERPELLHSVC